MAAELRARRGRGKHNGLFTKHRGDVRERRGETEAESQCPDCSLGLLTSLEDSGESSVVVVETVRPEL